MRQRLVALCLLLFAGHALAWNAAGHRLVAAIAWQQMSPASQAQAATILNRHPDHERWLEKARSSDPATIFAEAATWPDDIRSDPRFYDEGRDAATPPLPGLADTARHRRWHYVDFDIKGRRDKGEADIQIERLTRVLRQGDGEAATYALPWLLHLVADLHQPLHVGYAEDDGATEYEIENPFNKRLPFSSLHTYWDDLPGPPWLRGPRLEKLVQRLLADHPAPAQGTVAQWRDESHRLLAAAYPDAVGSLLPIVSEDFNQRARAIANQRLVAAGYRLGRLLDPSLGARVSRETQ